MPRLILLTVFLAGLLCGCITEEPDHFNGELSNTSFSDTNTTPIYMRLPKKIDVRRSSSCNDIIKNFKATMRASKIRLEKERTKDAVVFDGQNSLRHYILVVKVKNQKTGEWNKILKGERYQCGFKGRTLDVILSQ